MSVTLLNAPVGIGDNNSNPVAPSAGVDRYWRITVFIENQWATVPSTITVDGTVPTVLTLIDEFDGPTFHVATYGCKDADFGTDISVADGSLTYNVDGDSPPASNTVVIGEVFAGVDQTTPFVDTDGVGRSLTSANNTQNCISTVDEVNDGYGSIHVACSKTGTTWDLTDNGYTATPGG